MSNFDLFSVFSRISDYIGGNEQRTKEEEINAPWGKNEVSIQEEQKVFSRGEIKGFFNTIGEVGETLKESKANANKQESRILELMTEPCTPFEVHRLYCLKYPEVPITSIRRAMSNMSSKGLLEKTDQKKTEKYGKSNFVWKKVGA